MTQSKNFETTYTRYSFAPLVALGIAVAEGLKSVGSKFKPAHRKTSASIGGHGELAA